ncbi:subtilisin-like serine protease [Hirsutella rhossiliensis]|uniref:Subtilisin-like serine protease n=1 Tax=Hirsutella rhossiliensis TaxID=111463 RepID=A0A9P8N818_9HYPO|nr:subtilisin-like serine protease [Hirsutella rhossiliensis]KAH0966327.1 subtilisin-like serine protease [Hirsutella rhossiliensis]
MPNDFRPGPWSEAPPPFSIQLLKPDERHGSAASEANADYLASLLPASYRTESHDVAAAGRHVDASVEQELDLRRLNEIHDWLWAAGRPAPPRPLHHQLILGREILVTERIDMHLVWTTGRMFLKPIPRFLLEPRFWTTYLSCHQQQVACAGNQLGYNKERKRGLRKRALGFLFSYAALISHESDFRIAMGKQLLPPGTEWPDWRVLVEQLDTEHIYAHIDRRFYHGELRLSRLNKIYSLLHSPLRGYMSHWDQYGAFFHDTFAWLATAVVYVALVLTAMQVGLSTELGRSEAFRSASSGFTVFSILGPLIVAALIILAFCSMFVNNWIKAVGYRNWRLGMIRAEL